MNKWFENETLDKKIVWNLNDDGLWYCKDKENNNIYLIKLIMGDKTNILNISFINGDKNDYRRENIK